MSRRTESFRFEDDWRVDPISDSATGTFTDETVYDMPPVVPQVVSEVTDKKPEDESLRYTQLLGYAASFDSYFSQQGIQPGDFQPPRGGALGTPTFESGGSDSPQFSLLGGGNFFNPRLEGIDRRVAIGGKVLASNLYEYFDLDDNPLNRIRVIDGTQSLTSGYWEYRGTRLDSGVWHTFDADQIGDLKFVSGLIVGVDYVNIRVEDTDGITQRWSDSETVQIDTITANTNPPVASFDDFDAIANERYRLDSYISASDPDGYRIVRYRVRYNGAGTMTFLGEAVTKGDWVTVEANELDRLFLETPGISGKTTSTNFWVRAYDGKFWSDVDSGSATIAPNDYRPTATAADLLVSRGDTLMAHVLFSAEDRDQNTIKKVSFYDTGVDADGGYFTVGGVEQVARTWFTVDYSELDTVRYNGSSIFDVEKFRVRVFDGKYWSEIETGQVSTIEKPVIDTVDQTVINELEVIDAKTLFAQTDFGPELTHFEVVDLNRSANSGFFRLDGVRLAAGQVHQLTADQMDRLKFVGGTNINRFLDDVMIRAKNEMFWSDWSAGSVNTEPWMVDALTQLDSWADIPGTPVTLTYSFAQQVPFYYDDDAQERTNFQRMNDVMQNAVRRALSRWSAVTGITFVEVADNLLGGMLRIGTADLGDPPILGWAYVPDGIFSSYRLAGDIWINNESVLAGTIFDPFVNQDDGSPGFGTLIHEIGHAIGLSHPFDQVIRLPDATDSQHFTVMAYQRFASGLEPWGPQLYDVAAVQSLYGINAEQNTGDTVYSWTADEPAIITLWDAGGIDVLNFEQHNIGIDIDLREGRLGSFGGETENFSIAYGTQIENLRGGSGNDTLTGNQLENSIIGNNGRDMITGWGGNDYLSGGAGSDRYFFGVADGHDTINENKGGGWDRIRIDLTGIEPTSEGDSVFAEVIAARRVDRDLQISVSPRGGQATSSITIKNMEWGGSRVETIDLFMGNSRVARSVDLQSIFVQATDVYRRFEITEFSSKYGQVALLS